MEQVLNVLNSIVTHFPVETLVGALTGSAVLTPVTKRLKAKSDLFKQVLVWAVFAVGSGVWYLLHTPIENPSIIAVQASVLYATSQPIYAKLFKPLGSWFADQMTKAAAFDAQVKEAKVAATADFSS